MSGTRRKVGRLGPQVEGYRAGLAQRGRTPGTARNMLKDLGQVGLWLWQNQKPWPSASSFVTAYGQFFMAADTRTLAGRRRMARNKMPGVARCRRQDGRGQAPDDRGICSAPIDIADGDRAR